MEAASRNGGVWARTLRIAAAAALLAAPGLPAMAATNDAPWFTFGPEIVFAYGFESGEVAPWIWSPCPTTCATAGFECGELVNGCGSTVSCGDCIPPQFCGGGGVANRCGGWCVPQTCISLGAQCGDLDDGCGRPLHCGDCPPGQTCIGNPRMCVLLLPISRGVSSPPNSTP